MTETITPRRFARPLSDDIPRHWLPGNEVVSSILNAYTVLVPANDSFYIRTLKECLPRIASGELRARCHAFILQEAQHGVAHKRYWDNLDAQGYRFRGFESQVDRWVFRLIERVAPPGLRLSLVSCVEHINAGLGHEFLSQQILAEADPRMRDLMEWHFAEEIEHRCVAFDALQAVSSRYPTRVLGFALTVGLFYALITSLSIALLAQDGILWRKSTWTQWMRHLGSSHHMCRRTLGHLREYLRPGFHPSGMPSDGVAAAVLGRQVSARPPAATPLPPRTAQEG